MNVAKQFLQLASQYAPMPSYEDIAALAQKIWEQGGQNAEENWLQAEAQLKSELIAKFANALQKSFSPVLQELTGQIVELSEEYDGNLAAVIDSHIRAEDIRDEVLADNLKFYRNHGNYQTFVFEDSPKLRTLYMDLRFHRPRINSYGSSAYGKGEQHTPVTLSLPYVIYVVHTCQSGSGFYARQILMAFSNKPIKNLDQTVNIPLLPNISKGGSVCISCEKRFEAPAQAALNMIDFFWQSQFNYMLFPPIQNESIPTFEMWAKMSKENPLFALGVNWPTSSFKLRSIVDNENRAGISKLKRIIAENKQTYIKEIRKVLEEISALHPINPVV